MQPPVAVHRLPTPPPPKRSRSPLQPVQVAFACAARAHPPQSTCLYRQSRESGHVAFIGSLLRSAMLLEQRRWAWGALTPSFAVLCTVSTHRSPKSVPASQTYPPPPRRRRRRRHTHAHTHPPMAVGPGPGPGSGSRCGAWNSGPARPRKSPLHPHSLPPTHRAGYVGIAGPGWFRRTWAREGGLADRIPAGQGGW